ncbi:MAG: hypothetical protein ACMUIP_01965 [bacterium]
MAPSYVRVVARLHVKHLTGENAGQVLSSEITLLGCRPREPAGKARWYMAIYSESCIGHGDFQSGKNIT